MGSIGSGAEVCADMEALPRVKAHSPSMGERSFLIMMMWYIYRVITSLKYAKSQ